MSAAPVLADRPAAPAAPGRRSAGRGWTLWVPLVLLAVGAAVRLRQYAAGRSLWLDEAFLAASLTTRGPVELVSEPLEYSQSAPPGWLLAVRLSVGVLGDGERALRLVPLLFGLAALPLAWLLARRLLGPGRAPVALLLVALSPPLVTYANELKPYSADVAAVLTICLLALRVPVDAGLRERRLWTLTAAGAVLVWLSTIVLLAMAAVSVVLVLRTLRVRGWQPAGRTALALVPWTLPGAAVALLLTELQRNALLVDYWAPTFPRGAGDLPFWLGRTVRDLAVSPLTLTVPLLALGLVALGVARLVRDRPGPSALVLCLVPAAVLAAAVSSYPLSGRLALWLVPLTALVLAAALPSRLTTRTLPWAAAVGVGLLLVTGPALEQGARLLVERTTVQELEPVLLALEAQRQPGDLVLVDRSARAAFDYYAARVPGLSADAAVGLRPAPPACTDLAVLDDLGVTDRRTWVVFSHQTATGPSRGSRTEIPRRLAAVADVQRVLEAPGAAAYLLAPRSERGPEVTDDPARCLVRLPD